MSREQYFEIHLFGRAVPRKGGASETIRGRDGQTRARGKAKVAVGRKEWTVQDVISEMTRSGTSHPHVSSPRVPILWAGSDPTTVLGEVLAEVGEARDETGKRGIRKDAKILAAVMGSWPISVVEMTTSVGRSVDQLETYLSARLACQRPNDVPTDWIDLADWLDDCTAKQRRDSGDRLASMMIHLDESHPHWHAVHRPDFKRVQDGTLRMSLARIHPVMRIRERAEPLSNAARQRAEAAALIAWGDEWHQEVGSRYGHRRRSGAPRAKREREAHLAIREAEARADRAARSMRLSTGSKADPVAACKVDPLLCW